MQCNAMQNCIIFLVFYGSPCVYVWINVGSFTQPFSSPVRASDPYSISRTSCTVSFSLCQKLYVLSFPNESRSLPSEMEAPLKEIDRACSKIVTWNVHKTRLFADLNTNRKFVSFSNLFSIIEMHSHSKYWHFTCRLCNPIRAVMNRKD